MKAVIDTSVFVSYLLTRRGVVAWILALWHDHRFEVVTSNDIFSELAEVLNRPEFASRIRMDRRHALLLRLRQEAIWTSGDVDATGAMPDPSDDMLASAALEADAEFIVTRDAALLAVGSYEGVRIVNPDEFVSVVVRS